MRERRMEEQEEETVGKVEAREARMWRRVVITFEVELESLAWDYGGVLESSTDFHARGLELKVQFCYDFTSTL